MTASKPGLRNRFPQLRSLFRVLKAALTAAKLVLQKRSSEEAGL
jgi:hypothetical protein